ncbi:hypothetical protein ES703_107097 [subsurface metagenome]
MKGKGLFKLLGAIALAAVIAIPFAAGCAAPEPVPGPPGPAGPAGAPGAPAPVPAPAPTPTPAKPISIINAFALAFGTSTYCIFTGFEGLFEDHPWIRVVSTETPGSIWDIQKLMKDPEARKDTIINSSPVNFKLAIDGVEPYFDKPYPEAANIKVLASFNCGLITFVTLDKNLVDPRTWEGKRIGTGREPQTWWTLIPKSIIEHGYGVTPKYSYLGIPEAVNALLDGKADVIVLGGYASPDLAVAAPKDALLKLEASGRDFYYVDLDTDIIEKASALSGLAYTAGTVEANILPNQPNLINVMIRLQAICAHTDFPEELACEFVKTLIEKHAQLADIHALGKLLTPEGFVSGWPEGEEIYHEGALRAYKEAGLTIHP